LATSCAFALRQFLPEPFQTLEHQDPLEFFLELIKRIEDDLRARQLTTDRATIIEQLFEGSTRDHIQPSCCQGWGLPGATFRVHTLPLRAGREKRTTIDSCLKASRYETGPTDIVCPRCGKHPSKATRENSFVTGPRVLVLQLMRYRYNRAGERVARIDTPVSFRDRLLLPMANGEAWSYSLRAVVEHSGTATFGHHIAHVKVGNEDSAVWWRCNDATIEPEEPQRDDNQQVHLLFYDLIQGQQEPSPLEAPPDPPPEARRENRARKLVPFDNHVIDAVQALETPEKPFVPVRSVNRYVSMYFDSQHPPRSITRLVKNSITRLTVEKVLKQKANSVSLRKK
jgi:hypothetical protein